LHPKIPLHLLTQVIPLFQGSQMVPLNPEDHYFQMGPFLQDLQRVLSVR